jgi:hypothetical protein
MIFTKGLAKQLAEQGHPRERGGAGPIWTPLQVTGGSPGQTGKIRRRHADEAARVSRPSWPGAYVLLASPESSYATGQVYAAVGGRSAVVELSSQSRLNCTLTSAS